MPSEFGTRHEEGKEWRESGPPLHVRLWARFDSYSGYGTMAGYLACGMARVGAEVSPVPISVDTRGLTEELLALLARPHPDRSGPWVYYYWPGPDLPELAKTGPVLAYTMWESQPAARRLGRPPRRHDGGDRPIPVRPRRNAEQRRARPR